VLRYHSIRPGDRLAFHGKQTVRKLRTKGNGRFFFIPVSHKGHFAYESNGLPVMLAELATDSTFPFRMRCQKCAGASREDPGLPDGVPLTVQGLISEDAVLATKIYEQRAFQAFHLPLRTRITVGVERDAMDKTKRNILLANSDSYAEEVSEDVYDEALKVSGRTESKPPNTDFGKYM